MSKIKYTYFKILKGFSIEDYIGYRENEYHDVKKDLCYDFYKIFYKYENKSYIAYTKHYITPKELLYNILSDRNTNNILYAYVKKERNSIQVTDIIKCISGPYHNFNNLIIDFKWIFFEYDELIIMYDDNILNIDINSNKIISGYNKKLKLLT